MKLPGRVVRLSEIEQCLAFSRLSSIDSGKKWVRSWASLRRHFEGEILKLPTRAPRQGRPALSFDSGAEAQGASNLFYHTLFCRLKVAAEWWVEWSYDLWLVRGKAVQRCPQVLGVSKSRFVRLRDIDDTAFNLGRERESDKNASTLGPLRFFHTSLQWTLFFGGAGKLWSHATEHEEAPPNDKKPHRTKIGSATNEKKPVLTSWRCRPAPRTARGRRSSPSVMQRKRCRQWKVLRVSVLDGQGRFEELTLTWLLAHCRAATQYRTWGSHQHVIFSDRWTTRGTACGLCGSSKTPRPRVFKSAFQESDLLPRTKSNSMVQSTSTSLHAHLPPTRWRFR